MYPLSFGIPLAAFWLAVQAPRHAFEQGTPNHGECPGYKSDSMVLL